MSATFTRSPQSGPELAEKALNAAVKAWNFEPRRPAAARPPRAFATVSRQPGTGAVSFSDRLAERLCQQGQDDWQAWERELVEKVSAETGLAKDIIESIPEHSHNWLVEFLQSLSANPNAPDLLESRAYKQVVLTIYGLAANGHAIIVGQGGNFITAGLRAGIHLRLVAPLEHRIKYVAERDGIPLNAAAARIAESEKSRDQFYRRYWPGKLVSPEIFTLTLNSAELNIDQMVECVVPLIQGREQKNIRSF
jgi:hypothetical protein